MSNNFEKSIEHAWKYFELHSQQRISIFNFFLITTGLITTGIGICLQETYKFLYLISILSFCLLFVTVLFWKLDQRVSLMIKAAEKALISIEKSFTTPDIKLFFNDSEKDLSNGIFSIWSFGFCFRIAFLSIGIISLFTFIVSIIILIK